MNTQIEIDGGYTRGMTAPKEDASIKAAVDVEVERFIVCIVKGI